MKKRDDFHTIRELAKAIMYSGLFITALLAIYYLAAPATPQPVHVNMDIINLARQNNIPITYIELTDSQMEKMQSMNKAAFINTLDLDKGVMIISQQINPQPIGPASITIDYMLINRNGTSLTKQTYTANSIFLNAALTKADNTIWFVKDRWASTVIIIIVLVLCGLFFDFVRSWGKPQRDCCNCCIDSYL
jgi:hypothetical protein